MNKRVSLKKIQEICSILDVCFPQGLEHITQYSDSKTVEKSAEEH